MKKIENTKTNENAVVNNATKTNENATDILTVAKMHTEVTKSIVGYSVKQYTDTSNYTALGVLSKNKIEFSVNCKKTKYNIYCTKLIYDTIKNGNYSTDTIFDGETNTSSKTIPYAISTQSTNDIMTMIDIIKKSLCEKIA